ncbi:hypothetical protein PR003_g7995 [Phytophthora rubi]|uniref:Uncharacterized protein n=2 Tax=Phytophthora TaxID=4783 RepID=A0A6A4FKQ9_9STRA|nr:hypothetical protein PF003_g12988 [Phytophthora fragariae]KAE9263150.1 hypothetical protein PF008_g32434 [Phytophthora fragariae]KAE9345339.1 hypothetical protein PR003_g7995 [Phytophthora rubi]
MAGMFRLHARNGPGFHVGFQQEDHVLSPVSIFSPKVA